MESYKTALLVGATGLVGRQCLNYLLQNENYSQVKILTRRLINIENSKLIQHKIDFNKLQNYSDEIKADDIFCCLGTTIKKAGSQKKFKLVDFDYPLQIAKTALQNRAKRYSLVTALGANKDSKIFYNKVKGELETEISKLNFDCINIFRPSLLLGNRNEFRLGEKLGMYFMKVFGFLFVGKLKKYRGIQAVKVAKAMVIKAQQNLDGINIFESDEIQELAG